MFQSGYRRVYTVPSVVLWPDEAYCTVFYKCTPRSATLPELLLRANEWKDYYSEKEQTFVICFHFI